jgi:flagellar biosynthesis protein FlhG
VHRNATGNSKSNGAKLAQILVVTSGKGGVGKTSLSVNLGTELASHGYRIMFVDADLGLANAHILLGANPTQTLTEYLEGQTDLSGILTPGPYGMKIISGGQGVQEMANLDEAGRNQVLGAIQDLRPYCDLVLVDTGAGVSKTVTDFVGIADHTLVVTNANFAAVANAYGIVKVMYQDGYTNPMHLIVNRAHSPEEAQQVFLKLKSCTQKFLEYPIHWMGLVPEDPHVNQAVQKRTPFTQAFPNSLASNYIRKLTESIEGLLANKSPVS